MESSTYLEAIHSLYPQLVVQSVKAHTGEGQFNDILIINDELVFRFPRYVESAASLADEVGLLKIIQAAAPIPVPAPTYVNLTAQPGQAFLGYPMLSGQPLWRQRWKEIVDRRVIERIAFQLAEFLTYLHHLPTAGWPDSLPVQDAPEVWAQMYADIRQNLFPLMRPQARLNVSGHFEAYLESASRDAYPLCIRHGDFGPSNILYDAGAQKVTGIIDFDSVGLGDAAVDIASVSCYGEPFFESFCAAYLGIEALLARARFYKGTFALQEALHGFKNNDQEAFDSGMAEYV